MTRQLAAATCLALALALSACVEEPTPIPTPRAAPSPSPMARTPTLDVTPTLTFPTAAPVTLTTYRHRSGVFTLSRPADWDVFDDSTDQRLLVRFIPPVGSGSRVTLEVTSPGPLTPDEMHGEAESYITRTYGGNAAYQETGRSDLPDGRFQVTFAYNDGRGATGTETLTVQQAGNFFAALRVFLADRDKAGLGAAMATITSSLTIDPKASWGLSVGAINPAELLLVNTLLWQASSDRAYYLGEVYNASPSAIANVNVKISVCDQTGVVLAEVTQPGLLRQMIKGGTVPFIFTLDKPPHGVNICAQSATADPAHPDPSYTTSLSLNVTTRYPGGFTLSTQGQVGNPGLSPVQNIKVVIVVYDAKNTVVGLTVITSTSGQQLQPGQSLPIKYTFEALGGKPDHVATLVEADVIAPTNPSLNP